MAGNTRDSASIQLRFADGSIGTVHYLANGSKSFPKERLEVFVQGRILQMDNFRVLRGFGWPGFRTMRLMRQDKGQVACARAFLESIRTGKRQPIPMNLWSSGGYHTASFKIVLPLPKRTCPGGLSTARLSFDEILRTLHTIRFLKPRQVVWQVRHRLTRPPCADVRPAPPLRCAAWRMGGTGGQTPCL